MDIIRNPDGGLVVPLPPERHHESAEVPNPQGDETTASAVPTTRVLHPGEGGYNEALSEWDLQQSPDRAPVVSTASGRKEAMSVVHAVAISPEHAIADAVMAIEDPAATGEALRFVLVGGTHSVEAFASEVAKANGASPLAGHAMTKIIGEVLAELDK